jgi:branched-chain amino acid transport system permease protein
VKGRGAIWALRVGGFAAAAVVVALLPRVLSDFRASQFALVAVYFIALLGLNVLTGYTGQISLGHGAFMAIGAYTTAILVSDQGLKVAGHTFSADVRDVATIPLAGLVAGVAGVLFGIPALRLTGLYLALATFAVAVALPSVVRRADAFTGGSSGVNLFGLERVTGLGIEATVAGHRLAYTDWVYYLSWSVAGVLFVVAWLLLRGRTGRALRAIRDSEVAAASSGVNPATYKTFAFGVSAFYAGIAGSLFALTIEFVNPSSPDPVRLSLWLLVGLVAGGLGSLGALLAGALLIEFLPDLAQELTSAPGTPDIVYGAVLILTMLLLPTGFGGLLRRLFRPLTERLYTRRPAAPGDGAAGERSVT